MKILCFGLGDEKGVGPIFHWSQFKYRMNERLIIYFPSLLWFCHFISVLWNLIGGWTCGGNGMDPLALTISKCAICMLTICCHVSDTFLCGTFISRKNNKKQKKSLRYLLVSGWEILTSFHSFFCHRFVFFFPPLKYWKILNEIYIYLYYI